MTSVRAAMIFAILYHSRQQRAKALITLYGCAADLGIYFSKMHKAEFLTMQSYNAIIKIRSMHCSVLIFSVTLNVHQFRPIVCNNYHNL